MATSSSTHGDGGARFFIELGERENGSACRGGEWGRGARGRLQGRVEGPRRAGVDERDVDVLGWLGGIPPSSLEARGGRRQGGRWAWAGWAVA